MSAPVRGGGPGVGTGDGAGPGEGDGCGVGWLAGYAPVGALAGKTPLPVGSISSSEGYTSPRGAGSR
ncbi:hypothetical protein [Micromonospora craniellae]|uniref:hypothetical protein n=1 Tax=Micromonospora craniellae TaxID=2294034 RepID=UPI001314B015|nr:hypothetical protein [Micromonospora craniellae]QOC90884.1 hypothetical protein ID554_22800 [Micromonospora craniellae]